MKERKKGGSLTVKTLQNCFLVDSLLSYSLFDCSSILLLVCLLLWWKGVLFNRDASSWNGICQCRTVQCLCEHECGEQFLSHRLNETSSLSIKSVCSQICSIRRSTKSLFSLKPGLYSCRKYHGIHSAFLMRGVTWFCLDTEQQY